jgi:hypothetical protein
VQSLSTAQIIIFYTNNMQFGLIFYPLALFAIESAVQNALLAYHNMPLVAISGRLFTVKSTCSVVKVVVLAYTDFPKTEPAGLFSSIRGCICIAEHAEREWRIVQRGGELYKSLSLIP